jgi:hypothetical protein
MSYGRADLINLKECLREAHGDPGRIRACEAAFLQAGGRVEQARAFIDPDGKVVAVILDGKLIECRGVI